MSDDKALAPVARGRVQIVETDGGMQVIAPAPSTPRSLRNTRLTVAGAATLDGLVVWGFFHHIMNVQLLLFMSTGVVLFTHKLLWQSYGREELTLEADHLVLQKCLGPFRWSQRIRLGDIHEVRTRTLDAEALAERQPAKLGEAGRVIIGHTGGLLALFGGADEDEAARIVERIRRALREHAERNVRFR